jgi:hypothetical protein
VLRAGSGSGRVGNDRAAPVRDGRRHRLRWLRIGAPSSADLSDRVGSPAREPPARAAVDAAGRGFSPGGVRLGGVGGGALLARTAEPSPTSGDPNLRLRVVEAATAWVQGWGRVQAVRCSTLRTCIPDHKPPCRARMPRSLRAVAMPSFVSTPLALMVVMIGRTVAANVSARACLTAVALA